MLTPRLRGFEWVLLPIALVAAMWLEVAVLIVPIVVVAWLMKAPGATWRSVAAAAAGLGIYFAARWGWGPGVASLASPDTGLGFTTITTAESARLFANAPWLFWAHNVGVTLLTVLASEPRAGEFVFIRSLLRGTVPPWMWLHVLSSLATTAVVCVGLATIRSRPQRDRLIAAFGAVLAVGGSALGFLYTRDRIALPVGIGYAMLVYVSLSALLERVTSRWLIAPSCAAVAVLGICWTIRGGEFFVALRETAWDYHTEWTERYEPAATGSQNPLMARLHASAMERYPPDPRRDPQWSFVIFPRHLKRLEDACVSDANRVVNQVGRRFLQRQPDSAFATNWVERLEDRTASVRDVVRSVVLSPEYIQRLGETSNPTDGVTLIYRDLFDRPPDPEGAKWAESVSASQGFVPLIRELLVSEEYRNLWGEWQVPGGGATFCR